MLSSKETNDREWLRARFHVLELAAILDRLEAAAADSAPAEEDRRVTLLLRAIDELRSASPDRAERILRLYSEMAAPAV